MWKKTLIGSTVGLVGFSIGMTVGRVTSEVPTHQVSERIGSLASPTVPQVSVVTSGSQSKTTGPVNNDQPPGRSRQSQAEPISINTDASSSKTTGQNLKSEASIALTSDQQLRYNDLSQRIETARYGGFTMGDLQTQMADMPREYKGKLLEQVVKLVNSGELDPKKFVEGVH